MQILLGVMMTANKSDNNMNKSFLPEGYEVPKAMGGSGYMKLQEGANKFRVLSEAITGYEVWTVDNKPVRFRDYPKTMPANIRADSKVKHFWCFAVWNYWESSVQILEITQASIRDQMYDYYKLEEYGDPTQYDLNINRTGEGLDTSYTVQAFPPKPIAGEIIAEYQAKNINLAALFDNGNPFDNNEVVEEVVEDVPEGMQEVKIPPMPRSIQS